MPGPRRVTVTEVGPRDGWQIEPDFIPTETKVALIDELIEAGIRVIEFSSFVSPKAVPQLADAAEVLAGVDRSKGARFAALVPNAKGAERAAEAGVDEMRVFLSASESHNQKNVNRSVEESLKGFEDVMRIANESGIPVEGAIATSFGCPFEGDVPVGRVGDIAARYRDLGMQGLSLGDTTGMATPVLVAERCRYLREHVPELPIALHFHNTRGIGLVNVITGLAEGIDIYESSFAGLGGCPLAAGATVNICTEDLVYLLHEIGIETGIDLDRLCGAARNMEEVIGRTLPGLVL
jgi:hydroxymethylglutaryl-CoA lyase